MRVAEIKEGSKFHDDRLLSQPPEYRVHRVLKVDEAKQRFEAVHVASKKTRTFALSNEITSELRKVDAVIVHANLDDLVAEKVRVQLVDGGVFTGVVTAIRYQHHTINGKQFRSVESIELDHSGATSYALKEIKEIAALA